MGALKAARLSNFIVQALRPLTLLTHFWSDSQITLHWIKGQKHTDTFVTHRVTEILSLSRPDHWQLRITLQTSSLEVFLDLN